VINGLDLFSGIGGLSLALQDWVRPIAYCEQDRYCQALLLSKMQRGELPVAGVWDDVRTLNTEELPAPIDIIYGGFPCQDISVAGNGIGLVGERSGLYWQIERLVKEANPKFIFLENVPAIRTRGLNAVIQSLAELGYDCRWTVLSAKEVGACHVRKRWFLLAHANGAKLRDSESRGAKRVSTVTRNNGEKKSLADTPRERFEINVPGRFEKKQSELRDNLDREWWSAEPDVGRVVNGLPNRVDRIRALGNAVVPVQAKEAFKRLLGDL
jgi:DNA (cytosine-5)-methyltransferase 1